MDAVFLRYGYFYKAEGEGSRGGKVVGHTASGKPIYDKDGHKDQPKGRLPFPGEEAHKLPPMNDAQKRKTFMPPEGSEPHYADSPNRRGYKMLIREFKRAGIDFMGHISYDPQTDKMIKLSDHLPQLIAQVQASKKPGG